MKKRTVAISIALASVLAVSPAVLSGCSGDHYTEISVPAQDTSYIVTSQGGSAVAYGNYVYFINGTRGYDDTDGNSNVWDEVVKGALYRAELNGEKYVDGDGLTKFRAQIDDKGLEFKYEEGKDYYDNPINIVNSTKIAPKTIGTESYSRGGIFIYDNAVFFATPNNEKSSTGTVQTGRTDFFMMPLNGGEPTKIYTTSENVDTKSSAYAFYKYNNAVYLVVNEGTNIVSVKVNHGKGEAADPVTFKVNATSVYLPVRDTYYNGISANTPEDFIYFVRNVKDSDQQRAGTVIEAMRPDGSENFVVSMNGREEKIEAVRDGVVFYRTKNKVGNDVIAYDNLHNMLMEYSAGYKKEQDALDPAVRNKQIGGKYGSSESDDAYFPTEITSTITATFPFRPDALSNTVYFIGATSSAINVYATDGNVETLCKTAGTPLFIQENYLYFSGSESDFYRVPLYPHMDGYGEAQKLADSTVSAGISCDYAAGYFTYFAEVDKWANGYTYFYKVDGPEGMEPQFVGTRAKSDIPTKEQLEDENKEEGEE